MVSLSSPLNFVMMMIIMLYILNMDIPISSDRRSRLPQTMIRMNEESDTKLHRRQITSSKNARFAKSEFDNELR
jgi:hypothetical protein